LHAIAPKRDRRDAEQQQGGAVPVACGQERTEVMPKPVEHPPTLPGPLRLTIEPS